MSKRKFRLPKAGHGGWLKGPPMLLTVLLLLFAATGQAQAVDGAVDSQAADTGITSFGIVSTHVSPNISFTVPLYVTLAVVNDGDGDASNDVYTPSFSSYRITNTCEAGYIGVNGLRVDAVSGGKWFLANSTNPNFATPSNWSNGPYMGLQLGDLDLVPLRAANPQLYLIPADKTEDASNFHNFVSGAVSDSPATYRDDTLRLDQSTTFSNVANGTWKPIPSAAEHAQNYLELPFTSVVENNWWASNKVDSSTAAAQWRITYDLVRVDESGHELKAYTYSGAAENYVWDATTKSFTTQGVKPLAP